jgi:hypothetical protein
MILTTSVCATEAHCFSRWYYPYPQQCRKLGPSFIRRVQVNLEQTAPKQEQPTNIIVIPLIHPHPSWPTLEDIDWGHVGDERMEGIAKLRALGNGP